ncbi:MAG TPA: GIDE domain-containing protein [Thiobacillaceae bacterium]|nr:GIDE domain-containing protein [Thiobacillaceae bacterium]HNU63190.1 GIDE domain-containing protein [Thiobacillaceae bacterium]
MFRAWRGRFFVFLFFIQAALVGLAFNLGMPLAWKVILMALAVLNLMGWLAALRIARAINDTPTSRVASAAQGYVELHGHARPHQGQQLMTPFSQLPCLWYRFKTERRTNDRWEQVESGESLAPFDLEDASGRCTIEPAGAHIQTTHKETRNDGEWRHTEEVLLKGDRLYALGAFRSVSAHDLVLDARREEGELLAEWKADRDELHRRFDLDGDGDISPREWTLARLAARREIARQHRELRTQATRHHLSKPADRRPYLISNLSPDTLGRRFAWLARLFLVLILGSLVGLTYLLKSGL